MGVALLVLAIFLVFMLGGAGWLIRWADGGEYLISGFGTATADERERMLKSGIREVLGNWLFVLAGMIAAIALFVALNVPYSLEVGCAIFMIVVTGMAVHLLKFSPERKRRQNRYVVIASVLIMMLIVAGVAYAAFSANELNVSANRIEVTGIYGVEWKLSDIEDVYLDDTLPEIEVRKNGVSTGNRSKGNFRLKELGSGKLFVTHDHPPYLYIVGTESYIIINDKDPEKTEEWYEQLQQALSFTHLAFSQ